MLNQTEPLPALETRSRALRNGLVRIPVNWRVVRFGCRIQVLEEWVESAPAVCGPVRLRVSGVAGDSGRLEIFCGEAGLCGVSAG